MILPLKISDDIFQKYVKHNPQNPQKAMQDQLVRYADEDPGDRVTVLSQEQRRRLERLHQLPFEDGETLVKWVERLANVRIGEVNVPLTAGQIKRLEGEAKFFNQDPVVYTERKIKDFFLRTFGG